METTKRHVRYIFNEKEKQEISEHMAQSVMERQEAEDGLKSVQAQFKSRIAIAQETINGCAQKITSGFEMRLVDCEIFRDVERNKVIVTRMDTGEEVETRAMTIEERQQKLEGV